MKMDKKIISFFWFFIIILFVSLIFGQGFLIAATISDAKTAGLTEKVQDQFWEIQDLKQNLSVCEWNRGVEQSIILDTVIRR